MTADSLATKDHIDNDHIPVLVPPPSPPPETHPAPLPTPLLTPNSNENGTASRCPLPPILKKPNATHTTDSSQNKARLLLTGLGGHNITRKPSNPLTPISPPPFAVSGEEEEEEEEGTEKGGDNATVIRPQHHQKRPYFVAGKAGKRRPVLARRKSSQTSVPTLLRSEVRAEGSPERENLVMGSSNLGHAGHGLDWSQDVEEKARILSAGSTEGKLPEIHISPAEQENQDIRQDALPSPPTENPIEPQPPSEGKFTLTSSRTALTFQIPSIHLPLQRQAPNSLMTSSPASNSSLPKTRSPPNQTPGLVLDIHFPAAASTATATPEIQNQQHPKSAHHRRNLSTTISASASRRSYRGRTCS